MTSLTERALRGALLFCLAAAAGAAPARAAEPIVIGEIDPLTGTLALQGTTVHQGIVWRSRRRTRVGIAGRRLILLSRDDEGRPERAIGAAEELERAQAAAR